MGWEVGSRAEAEAEVEAAAGVLEGVVVVLLTILGCCAYGLDIVD